ncbi:MAG: ASCH domain-containing protein [Candidatus Harrisonbacteria bacterium]|nr:ASCH domain-containing protein [Candidatus Harrisonbacteria bacterium]MBI3114629.1 ASCH domain-containing protein [Candidatus Harrisonbacteria bacterium]
MSKTKVPFLVQAGPMRNMILAGMKTATIRVGYRPCSAGDELVLYCHIQPWVVMADVVSVRHCKLSEVTAQEFKDEGYDDPATAMDRYIANLKPYHPEVGPDSIVTVVRFTNVRGKLADEYKPATEKQPCSECGASGHDHKTRGLAVVVRGDKVYCKKCGAYVRMFYP